MPMDLMTLSLKICTARLALSALSQVLVQASPCHGPTRNSVQTPKRAHDCAARVVLPFPDAWGQSIWPRRQPSTDG